MTSLPPDVPGADPNTPYALMGGTEFFHELVHGFYAGVGSDPVLKAMYPEADLGPAEGRFRLFLEQYWGGPTTYSDQRGHPRLRMRHAPYHIDEAARDRWLGHMRTSFDSAVVKHQLSPELQADLWGYLSMAADSMVNVATEPPIISAG